MMLATMAGHWGCPKIRLPARRAVWLGKYKVPGSDKVTPVPLKVPPPAAALLSCQKRRGVVLPVGSPAVKDTLAFLTCPVPTDEPVRIKVTALMAGSASVG